MPPSPPKVEVEDTGKHKDRKWDLRFLSLCDHISDWSEDPSRRVGSVIVGSGHSIVSTGYNGLPRGISESDHTRLSRENGKKYFWVEHAERNAIFNAARSGIALTGCTIYSSLFPCADCSRAIIQSGLRALVTRPLPEEEIRFADSMKISLEMLQEAGVEVRFIGS